YDEHWPIRTRHRQYPPAKFVFAEAGRTGTALDSIVSSGCIVSGSTVRNSVLSPDVRVNSYSEVDACILFSHVNIGRHCHVRKAIIDRDVHIPEGTTIGFDPEADRQRYFVTESGITVVTRDYSLFENPVTVDYFTSEEREKLSCRFPLIGKVVMVDRTTRSDELPRIAALHSVSTFCDTNARCPNPAR